MNAATTPIVSSVFLYDPATPGAIALDTPAWFAWLAEPTSMRFAYPLFDPVKRYIVGVMTVRKERRARGGAYWSAYRRCDGRLRKVYLGRGDTLTQARLDTIAHAFWAAAAGAAQTAEEGMEGKEGR